MAIEMKDFEVRVRVFGLIELENKQGIVRENNLRAVLHWTLLKYLLANPGREVTLQELLDNAWPDKPDINAEGTARVRLKRMREALRPIGLDKPTGLIKFRDYHFWLNPNYKLITDDDILMEIVEQLPSHAADDPKGLDLCIEALELFRGPYMEHTDLMPWLEAHRENYDQIFCALAQETLDRSIALKDDRAISLLRRRAAAIVPDAEELHRNIIDYLVERKKSLELMRYITDLSYAGGTGPDWLKTLDI